MNNREKAIEYGYDLADFIGDMALAYSPIIVFIITAMATVSIAIMGTLATNVAFDFIWGIATAICVDGLWLGVWLRVRSLKVTSWATGLRKTAMLTVALFMTLVAMAMSILITYQQVNHISDEILAMRNLLIDPLWFIVARGFLVTLCATLAIFFRQEKAEAIATAKKVRVAKAKVTVVESTAVELPQEAESIQEAMGSLALSPQAIAIREVMAMATVDGKLTLSLQEIALKSGAGYSTVKKHAPDFKKELGIE